MNERTDEPHRPARVPRDIARDLYRRGAGAIARTGGDNMALAVLAASAAAGAIGWIVAKRHAANRRRGG